LVVPGIAESSAIPPSKILALRLAWALSAMTV